MKWLFVLVVICAVAVDAQRQRPPSNVFSFFFNTIFRRGTSAATSASSTKLTSRSDVVPTVRTVTLTKTEVSEPTTTVSEFFTVTETMTERLIATSTLTRKMTATATHIITSCPDVGLRRINWKEIPNRIEEIMKYPTGVQALEPTALPDGPYIIGRSLQIESSAEEIQPSE